MGGRRREEKREMERWKVYHPFPNHLVTHCWDIFTWSLSLCALPSDHGTFPKPIVGQIVLEVSPILQVTTYGHSFMPKVSCLGLEPMGYVQRGTTALLNLSRRL